MVTAAEPYVRILIRVPVAYHLMRQYKCTRPGLMVLDADGRRVDAIPLRAKKAGQVAEWLRDTLAAPADERLAVRFANADQEAVLVNGIKLQGTIDSFDQFVVLLKNSVNQMVYKHAISTVVPTKNVRLPVDDDEGDE